ncbi:uncharacterized protein BO72DRAFT_509657 [Aspergillus fijiensis CBS 313.89]|uniref:BTB domain-containing protein n=1 Tax=Aspergillus fijiensis CBS 313.89 TaxID=1448319 RepID=A0A8G1RRB9_9EURO|nr:uncharacterized protein BO72DRAFT_509657 [Aspergillus fijiensis CBS 313.89]RAK77323.1 hypothetical protein BO72DRAFT_509657 [Aspergillus fijiensis CBS 313.89]
MEFPYKVIDPNGDVLLVLRQQAGRIYATLVRNGGNFLFLLPLTTNISFILDGLPLDHSIATSDLTPEPQRTVASQFGFSTSTLVNESIHTVSSEDLPTLNNDGPTDQIHHCIQILVSSKHLCFASRRFQEELSRLDTRAEPAGLLPYNLTNLDALYILLNILHCRSRQVPRQINLNLLCMVAELTQHYDCLEAVEAFARTWLENLHDCFPTSCSHDLSQWVFIAWAFRHHGLFRLVTEIALRESTESIRTKGLRIPAGLINLINKTRQYRIEEIVFSLYERMEYLLDHESCCSDCDQLMVGTLIHQLKPRNLFPPPQAPYKGLSLNAVLKIVNELRESRCKELIHDKIGCSGAKCWLIPETRTLLKRIDAEIVGLRLGDYLVD